VIINEWTSSFTDKYGHHFPSNYLCFDTEFTGSNERDDLIMEIGHVLVEDGRIVDKLNVVINWYDHPEVQHSWLDYKLNNMRHIVGSGWKLLPDYVKKNGMPPSKALKFYYKLFKAWENRDLFFVAQNGLVADERMLRGNFNRFINKPFKIPDNRYFDTGAIFKATQVWNATGDAINYKSAVLPTRSETLKSYFGRVCGARIPGIKWSLGLILEHYGLKEKHHVNEEDLHSAGYDAMCLHWIMEEYRSRICHNHAEENPFESPETLQRLYEEEMAKYKLANEKAKQEKAKKVQPEEPTPVRPKRKNPGLSQRDKRRRRRQRNL
jgi:hypothetical protein